ncbi:hypothetical protein B4U37_07805 [Sutcliffiella horikoshii]|uniref:Uncharacterized protein n=1 Tax=Sutcliffiella horikoshii TaxID=79883 RepID=A0ABM6KHV0_9BACI|nr:hypothetical protein B4U37_07805 [Sutcliffiella horikoshii]
MKWKVRRRPREEGTGETPQRSEAHGPPAGKRSTWNGNQPDFKISYSYKKMTLPRQSHLFFISYLLPLFHKSVPNLL